MESNQPPLLAVVLLPEYVIDAEAVANRLKERCGDRYTVRWEDPAEEKGVHVRFFYLNEQRVELAMNPFPLAWPRLEGPCRGNRTWAEAEQACRQHKAHLVLTIFKDGGDPVSRHLMLTDFVAAAAEAHAGLGVLWGEGGVLHSAEYFCEEAAKASRNDLPLFLWVDFPVVMKEGMPFVATRGLSRFGVMEVEGGSRKVRPGALLEKAYNIAYYLCTHGPVLNDGETIGGSAQERIQIRHEPSVLGRDETVIRLDFDGQKRGLLSRLFGV